MTASDDSEAFYSSVPVLRGFRSLMDPARYTPLPDDWTVGIADVVASTKAIAEKRYKAVNMAGAAVIASVTNALGNREFPFVFGGDGASFAVSPHDADKAREALAATAAWADGELGLTLRVALVPVAEIRRQGLTCAWRAMDRRTICLMRCFPAAASPGPTPLSSAANSRSRRRRPAPGPISPACPAGSSNSARRAGDPLGAGAAVARRRSGRVPRADRGDRGAGRTKSQCRAAGAGGGPGMRWPPPGVDLETRRANGQQRRAGVHAKRCYIS
jgi:hypothetical protein